jgi:hypothetical protein
MDEWYSDCEHVVVSCVWSQPYLRPESTKYTYYRPIPPGWSRAQGACQSVTCQIGVLYQARWKSESVYFQACIFKCVLSSVCFQACAFKRVLSGVCFQTSACPSTQCAQVRGLRLPSPVDCTSHVEWNRPKRAVLCVLQKPRDRALNWVHLML